MSLTRLMGSWPTAQGEAQDTVESNRDVAFQQYEAGQLRAKRIRRGRVDTASAPGTVASTAPTNELR